MTEWYLHWVDVHQTPPRCLVCGQQWSLRAGHLHHVTYMRLGYEEMDDLIPLCAAHHARLHHVFDRSSQWRRQGRSAASHGIVAMLRRHVESRSAEAAS